MQPTDFTALMAYLHAPPPMVFVPPTQPRERLAVLSCIHANMEALTAVLEFLESEYGIGAANIINLGDTVGYGPNPAECVDIARHFRLNLMGNHDEWMPSGPIAFGQTAGRALCWTRLELGWENSRKMRAEYSVARTEVRHDEHTAARQEFMRGLPIGPARRGEFMFVHGSPRLQTMEYILQIDTESHDGEIPPKMREIFALIPRVCFVGHSHIPSIITAPNNYLVPADFGNEFEFRPGQKCIVNVGSVGQPRDGDTRACVVVLDEFADAVRFHRVPYDVEATAAKIRAIPDIHDRNADRLLAGR